MVELDLEITDAELSEDVDEDLEHLGVGDHGGVIASDVKIALVELPKAALIHLGLVSSVDLSDVESLNLFHSLRCNESCKRNSQIVPERGKFTALVLQVVDELRVLTVLSHECFSQLEDRSVDLDCSVLLEDALDDVEGLFADGHLYGSHVACAFSAFRDSSLLVFGLHDLH